MPGLPQAPRHIFLAQAGGSSRFGNKIPTPWGWVYIPQLIVIMFVKPHDRTASLAPIMQRRV
ncbi:MAG: hypothetical protein CL790_00610 [Chloroflexi bacterium]|nr:hypothetical protein [Chloroflexota bacterium]